MRASVRLKPLAEQVMVITGASSGIGLATARMAAQRGARLVLAARNEAALETVCEELAAHGSEAISVVADVANEADVRRVAGAALERFGGFDTWVNNAGVTIYGRLEEVSTEDAERLMRTNFWGVFHGSRVAVEHLKKRGGALINLGSDLSEHAVPLMGIYSASKHAVMGLTDALRVELEREGAPVAVTLVRPSGIDTPIVPHAKNYMDVAPKLPPPVYAPSVVAEAILHAAEHPTRDIFAGAAARVLAGVTHFFPRTSDWVLRRLVWPQLRAERPRLAGPDGLHATAGRPPRERFGAQALVFRSSLYTKLARHGTATRVVGLGLLVLLVARAWSRSGVRVGTPTRYPDPLL